MVKSGRRSGLVYKRMDLHVHTPASICYEEKSATAEEIVRKALNVELSAIAITDHNTGGWLDKVTAAAKGKIAVFPGVEISCTGGKKGPIHIVCILDRTKGAKDIENLLGALNIKADKYGHEDACSTFSPCDVINIIRKHGGIAILAHVNSDHGVMHDMSGVPRSTIIQNPNLLAVEATDFENQEKKENRKRVTDLLDGSDQAYARKLAVIQSSDSHSVEAIGSRFTYLKVDEISLEGLRQCFCDPDVRIRQSQEFSSFSYPKITSLQISKGFLRDQSFNFHEGLNSIVGGKGVGKSLIIEFLRFALDQPSEDEAILKDHNDKLSKRLGEIGKLTLEFALEGGGAYRVTRTYDGVNNKTECIDLATGEHYEGEMCALFPILAYSQNEVIKIAEDGQAQLRLIDSFIDSSSFTNDIARLSQEISKKDKELAKSISASAEVSSYKKELSTVNEQIKVTTRNLKSRLFSEMKLWEVKKNLMEEHSSFHETLSSAVENQITNIKDEIQVPSTDNELKEDAQIIRAGRLSEDSLAAVMKALETAKKVIDKNAGILRGSLNQWEPRFAKKQAAFEAMLEKAGGNKSELEGERRRLERRKQEIVKELDKYKKQMDRLEETMKARNALLDKLDDVYTKFYQIRKGVFDKLTEQASGKLLLELEHSADRTKFRNELIAFRKGSYVREADIERLVQRLTPREFIDFVLKQDSDELSQKADLAIETAQKLISALTAREAFEEILGMAHEVYPDDVPSIKFNKGDGDYYPLSELSIGQKCTALLIIALSEGARPVLIDQPEDSLDNPSIYEDIVSKLRNGKEKRQFILTTHNSSVGVASDSDNFIVLKSTAEQGELECSGAIDRSKVRSQIIDHLEGGDKPYGLKSRKYNIEK